MPAQRWCRLILNKSSVVMIALGARGHSVVVGIGMVFGVRVVGMGLVTALSMALVMTFVVAVAHLISLLLVDSWGPIGSRDATLYEGSRAGDGSFDVDM